MTDKNGNPVKVGDAAVIVKGDSVIPAGSIGEVRAIHGRTIRGKPGPSARITKGPEGDPDWSAWCESDEFVVTNGNAK